MYEQIGSEFLESSRLADSESISNMIVTSIDDREKFLDSFLSEYLNDEKVREKDSLREKLKYKRHQLEIASKQMRKEEKKKKDADALAAGFGSQNSKNYIKKLSLNSKLKKKLKMYKLNKNEKLDYTKYEKINNLWNTYATSCLQACLGPNETLNEENVLNCLKQLDYHGCHLNVIKSSTKCLIGIKGIVLQDKRNVFYILTKENKIKILPKSGNLFEFELMNSFKMILVGSNMCYKPEMRTTKHAKIKTRTDIK
jgi:RNase P/RNase MRP subunit p29